jgi:nitrile hydratase
MTSEDNKHTHHHDHGHSHDDDHEHSHLDPTALRVRSLQTLLVDKGYVDPQTLNELIDTYENKVGPRNGAAVVARAWADPSYKQWLMNDATAAIASLDYRGRQGEHMIAVENTPDVHNIVVCTLCSCYPWPVLGLPPAWYKSAPYRSRVVVDPASVLAEFGVSLPEKTRIAVWDSTAEIRYLVIPQRPANSEHLNETKLSELVNRNSMIGTALATAVTHLKE